MRRRIGSLVNGQRFVVNIIINGCLTRNDEPSGITFTFITGKSNDPLDLDFVPSLFLSSQKVMAQLKDTCNIEEKMGNKLH